MSQFKRSKINKNLYQSLPKKLLIDKVRVIDPSEKIDSIQSIIVENGKIADILSVIPDFSNMAGKNLLTSRFLWFQCCDFSTRQNFGSRNS